MEQQREKTLEEQWQDLDPVIRQHRERLYTISKAERMEYKILPCRCGRSTKDTDVVCEHCGLRVGADNRIYGKLMIRRDRRFLAHYMLYQQAFPYVERKAIIWIGTYAYMWHVREAIYWHNLDIGSFCSHIN